MRLLTSSSIAVATWAQAILAAQPSRSGHAIVPYDRAPTYYPGAPWSFQPDSSRQKVCHVAAAPNGGDSAPAIIKAFQQCGHNGKVIFDEHQTYHVNSVMTTTGLSNVEVDVRGTLLWSPDIKYWLGHSLPVGYQNQSTAWIFGGDKVHLYSSNHAGNFSGNGQVWYDFIAGQPGGQQSNYPRRPHQITFSGLTNSVVEDLTFWQSQMWTMTLIHSNNVLLQDIYVNNTNLKHQLDFNTDGADTIYANNITFARWVVDNGDDGVTWKANSTNVGVFDSVFYSGSGLAMGSIGQYPDRYEVIENIHVKNCAFHNTWNAVWAKTWTGVQKGYPPNGGGGGKGMIKNILFEDLTLDNVQQLWYVNQCTSFSGQTGDCNTSKFQIQDVTVRNAKGTVTQNYAAKLQCSGAAPCFNMAMENIALTYKGNKVTRHLCDFVSSTIGFQCTGHPK